MIPIDLSAPNSIPLNRWLPLAGPGEDQIDWMDGGPNGLPRRVVFSLETAPNVTWWKAVEIWRADESGGAITRVETQDDQHGPVETSFAIDNFHREDGLILVLAKAKLLGVHTPMYRIPGPHVFGRTLRFRWVRD